MGNDLELLNWSSDLSLHPQRIAEAEGKISLNDQPLLAEIH